MDFTPASPQRVSDQYVNDAVMAFLSLLGNINPISVDTQYEQLSKAMSPELKVQFDAEVTDWKVTVKEENISEILKITEKEIVSDGKGSYKVTAIGRRERFASNEHIGANDEVIEMNLQLVAPDQGKQWFLRINSLTRQNASTFETKAHLTPQARERK
jgi:hypothetical protein